MTAAAQRPEDRRRSQAEPAPWFDALPSCFRSEAFAEDLPVDAAPDAAVRRPQARSLGLLSVALAAAVAVMPGLSGR